MFIEVFNVDSYTNRNVEAAVRGRVASTTGNDLPSSDQELAAWRGLRSGEELREHLHLPVVIDALQVHNQLEPRRLQVVRFGAQAVIEDLQVAVRVERAHPRKAVDLRDQREQNQRVAHDADGGGPRVLLGPRHPHVEHELVRRVVHELGAVLQRELTA